MSGMSEVNWAAAGTISGGDETVTQAIATALGLIHVLQVYTSSMVRSSQFILSISLRWISDDWNR